MDNFKSKKLKKKELNTIHGGYVIDGALSWAFEKIANGVWKVITETDPRKWNQPGSPTASGSKV
jgi:hypothetical protein